MRIKRSFTRIITFLSDNCHFSGGSHPPSYATEPIM
jgi:hypothetical protein